MESQYSYTIPIQFLYNSYSYTVPLQFLFLYSSFTIPIQFLYISYTIPIQFLYNSYTIPIQFLFLYNSYTIHIPIQFLYNSYTIPIPIQFLYNSYTFPIQFPYNSYTIPIQFLYNSYSYTIHIQFIFLYNSYTIHIQFIFLYNSYAIPIQSLYNSYAIPIQFLYNIAAIASTQDPRMTRFEHRQYVLDEIVQTERDFSKHMYLTCTYVLQACRDANIAQMDINILFGNIEAISKVSEVLLVGLQDTLRNATEKQTIGKQILLLFVFVCLFVCLLLLLFVCCCLFVCLFIYLLFIYFYLLLLLFTGLCFLMNARDLKDTYASYCRNLDEALTLLDKVSFSSILVYLHILVIICCYVSMMKNIQSMVFWNMDSLKSGNLIISLFSKQITNKQTNKQITNKFINK